MRATLLLIFCLSLFFSTSDAQRSAPQPLQNQDFSLRIEGSSKWFAAKNEVANLSVSEFFMIYRTALGLSQDDNFVLRKTTKDKYGWQHHRMQQYHRGIKVLGAEYILHTQNGSVQTANGKLATNITAPLQANITAKQAIEEALYYLAAERYMWNVPEEEARLKKTTKNEQATHYPKPELVLVDRDYPKHTGHYILAYMMDIFIAEPFQKERVFVEAYHGHILQSFNTLDHEIARGTANTRYNGEQTIVTDSTATNAFVLNDLSRANGIFIKNGNECEAVEVFMDEDNYWDNQNEAQDEVATDVLFGVEAAYDYFLRHFDLDSYDGNGKAIHAEVHYRTDYSNAVWTGLEMRFGDGDGKKYHPFTSFDIVVHEFMHAITENSADLEYRGESGALNEGFSDVFSKLVEYEYLPEKLSWRLASDIFIDSTANDAIRVMDDPKAKNKPAYYGGEYWSDNGGVHTNSALMNYWITLLCDGKIGTNEVGYDYDISMVGFEKMSEICYRMLTVYLTSTSNYKDAVLASLQSARDIYGKCSPEVEEVLEAWNVVGLGLPLQQNELLLQTNVGPMYCDVVDSLLTVEIMLTDCAASISQGTILDFYYQINEEVEIHEQDTLAFDLNSLESYTYHFDSLMTLTDYGETTLTLRVEIMQDSMHISNETQTIFKHNSSEDIDIHLFTPTVYRDNCGFFEDKYFRLFMSYEKCEKLEAGYLLPLKVEVDDSTYYSDFVLEPNSLFTGSSSNYIGFNLDMPAGITGSGEKEFFISIMDQNDIDSTNNTAKRTHTLYPPFELDFLTDFSNPDSDWADNITGSVNTNFSIEDFEGDAKLVATGDILSDLLWFRSGCEGLKEDIFNFNSIVVTEIPICVDLIDCGNPQLEFDLIQTKGDIDYLSERVDTEFTVMARVSASEIGENSSTIISDYIINPIMGEEFHHAIDLNGRVLENMILTIELFALSNEEGLLKGDNNIIDNIQITGCNTVQVKEIPHAPQFSIYPNPSSEVVFIEGNATITNITLIDNKGAVVKTYVGNTRKIELGRQLEVGIYYLKIASPQGTSHLKLVKI